MAGSFDFAPNSHSAVEIPPDEVEGVSMNGWEFTARPAVPYRAKFQLAINGLYWYKNAADTALDVSRNPTLNAGRLLNFYKLNRRWDTFTYNHEYLGQITCRFAEAVQIPKALPDSGGLVPEFTVTLIHQNPSF